MVLSICFAKISSTTAKCSFTRRVNLGNNKNSNMKITWLKKSFFANGKYGINSLTTNVHHHKENSQLTCFTNQLAGFYMMGNTSR